MSAKHKLGTPLAILLAGSLLSTGAVAMPAARQGAATGAPHAILALQTPAAATTQVAATPQ
ncbi:MAG: hypothetical protein M3Y74_21725, partial [Chloroflexota bacterium]|nr:hypothetical protein [Chloroflexota bacterium]